MKIKIGLKCEKCGDISYSIYKSGKDTTEKLELKKYCLRLKKHTLHKKIKLKS